MTAVPLFYAVSTCVAAYSGGWISWVGLPLNLIALPALDTILWKLHWRPSQKLKRRTTSLPAMILLCIANWGALLVVMYRLQSGATLIEFLGLASTAGIMIGSSSLPAAHELIHRRQRSERAVGLAMLLSAAYLHFRIEHVYGHHKKVGTHDDPGTARAEEGFGAYFPRALLSGTSSAWKIETQRLQRRGSKSLSIQNRMLVYAFVIAATLVAVSIAFGLIGAAFWSLQCLIAVHILEAANYAQHFGLSREKSGEEITAIKAEHSWDCESPVATLLLFGLPIHSQHHLDVRVSGTELVASHSAPRMHISFYWIVFAALIPGALSKLLGASHEPSYDRTTLTSAAEHAIK